MNKFSKIAVVLSITALTNFQAQAGNPDRQGEAGAYELTINPWGRSAVLFNTSRALGVEAMYLNPAGLSYMTGNSRTEVILARTNYLQGTGISINTIGLAQKLGENSTLGVNLNSMSFGDIPVTTTDQPEGIGATFSPRFINVGLSYAYAFEKISVGATFRVISEQTSNVTASGFAVDGGVQYTTGPKDNIHFGVSLKNVGSTMKYGGEGLSFIGQSPSQGPTGNTASIILEQRAAEFNLPSMLTIGAAYDFILNEQNTISLGANFTSNSFARDQFSGSLEYSFKKMFMIRGGYTVEPGATTDTKTAHTGLAAGASLQIPFKKGGDSSVGIDYAYRATNPFSGTHTLGVRISL